MTKKFEKSLRLLTLSVRADDKTVSKVL